VNSRIFTATIRHRRSRPRVHDFRYDIFMLYLDLDEVSWISHRVRWFSHNRANLFSFYDKDHMDRCAGSTKNKVMDFLKRSGTEIPDAKIFLLTNCRVLGYVFNPISLYYCHDSGGALRVVVAEVNNTFGEQYLYVVRCVTAGNDQEKSSFRSGRIPKALHVSPFISMNACYEFHLSPVSKTLKVGIVEYEEDKHVLDAQLWGQAVPLTSGSLGRVFLRYPLICFKTIYSIHSQALRLLVKRLRFYRQPSPSEQQIQQEDLFSDLRQS